MRVTTFYNSVANGDSVHGNTDVCYRSDVPGAISKLSTRKRLVILASVGVFLAVVALSYMQYRSLVELDLEGSWQGKVMDIPITFTIRAASSGTVILHEGHTSGGRPPNHEITMFYLEGDRLLATQYCDGGNRSRLEGKISADEKSIEFSFIDVTGSTRGGYLKDMVMTMIDAITT